MRLSPCPECARHVRLDAGVCPFCATPLVAPSNTRARVGALLLGAATVSTLAGCPRAATKYGGPPMPEPSDPAALESGPVEDTAEPDPGSETEGPAEVPLTEGEATAPGEID